MQELNALAAACALTARPPSLQSWLGRGSCCATLIEILGMLGVVDVVVFGWLPRPLRTALRGSLYDPLSLYLRYSFMATAHEP
jgi:hypothetical protein